MSRTCKEQLLDFFYIHGKRHYIIRIQESTVKASNFGPHLNFGLFFSEGLASIKTRPKE
jgi:hypothetical protein